MFFSNNASSANRPRKPLVHASLAPLLSSALLIGCGSDVVADPDTMMIALDGGTSSDGSTNADAAAPADAEVAMDADTEADAAVASEDAGVVVVETGELRVDISNIASLDGKLAWGLFDESRSSSFPNGDPMRGDWIPITGATMSLSMTELPPGRYAVLVYHDKNDNGSLDTGFFGQPVEDWGSTNNITHPFRGPGFDESAIDVTAGFLTTTAVRMHP